MALRAAVYHSRDYPQSRNTNCKRCGSAAPNDMYNPGIGGCASGQGLYSYDPVFGGLGGPPSARAEHTTIDWVESGVWIDGPSKHGVLFLGQLAETISIANGFSENRVYGPADPNNCHARYGSSICCHGHVSPTNQATGPCADSLINYAWIYHPAELAEILNNQRAPHGAQPTSTLRLSSLGPGFRNERTVLYQTVGVWFEPNTRRLYVAEQRRYMEGYDPLPVVHVLDVNC